MGKRDTKQALKETRTEKTETGAEYGGAIEESKGEQERIRGEQEAAGAELSEAYRGLGDVARYSPRGIESVQIDKPRPIDVSELRTTLPRIREFADTGGFTPGREASIMESVSGLKEFGRTGGLSEENINRMRGLGGFDEFAKTGGYSPEQIANIKLQALSPIGSYATGTRDELSRRAALTGGYTPGFDAANRQLQRDAARAVSDASLAANIGIQERVNEGRRWGTAGLAGAEAGLAGLQTGNKLAGLQAAGGLELNLQDTISKYRAAGLSLEQATARAFSEFDAMNVGNEMQANMFNASMRDSINRFNAGTANEADLFNIQNAQNMQLAGLGGLQNLYGIGAGGYQNERDRLNQLLGGKTQANLGYLGQQGQLATQPGIGGNILSGIGAAAGLASNFFAPGLAAGIGAATKGLGSAGNVGRSGSVGAWY